MADTWREFWAELETSATVHRHAEEVLELDFGGVEGVQLRGVSPGGLWAADVLMPLTPGEPDIVRERAFLLVEAPSAAELVMAVRRVLVRGPARG